MNDLRYNRHFKVISFADATWAEREPSGDLYGPFKGRAEAIRYLEGIGQRSDPGAVPATGPCPCACNAGGFCGGCGHRGCGG